MRIPGKTERRVVSAILITALIPLVASILIARTVISRVSATAFQPEFGAQLDESLGVYTDLVSAIKQRMRAEADAIAASEPLRVSVFNDDSAAVETQLERFFTTYPSLLSLRVETCDGNLVRQHERDKPVDPATEKTLTVQRALSRSSAQQANVDDCTDNSADTRLVTAMFATPAARFAQQESTQEFARLYHLLEKEHRDVLLTQSYVRAFAALLGLTILLAIVAGVLVVRPVVNRIARLAAATRPVAEGDLTVRVHLAGHDEVADLGRAFDHMLEELERSRARIEFLKRISEWQKMARRLAHEIKNPLTPIQLAVEECHRRYLGDDVTYAQLLQTTLEVVEEEVGTLRRLVGEFSSFARLPRAALKEGDLAAFLKEQCAHLTATEEAERERAPDDESALLSHIDMSFHVDESTMPTLMDTEMLHRALVNIIRNAAQALRDAYKPTSEEKKWGKVEVKAHVENAYFVIHIDDSGPGIDRAMRDSVFDPYVTTRRDGTGLGLSIVKKIVVDHGGTIEVKDSPMGGARFEIRLPRAGTEEALAAFERSKEEEEGSELRERAPNDT